MFCNKPFNKVFLDDQISKVKSTSLLAIKNYSFDEVAYHIFYT